MKLHQKAVVYGWLLFAIFMTALVVPEEYNWLYYLVEAGYIGLLIACVVEEVFSWRIRGGQDQS